MAFQGGRAFRRGDIDSSGFSSHFYDVTFGAQKYYLQDWTIGVAANYEYDHLSFRLGGTGEANTAQGALYGAYNGHFYYFLTDLVFGWTNSMQKNNPL